MIKGKCPHCGSWYTIRLNADKPLQVNKGGQFSSTTKMNFIVYNGKAKDYPGYKYLFR